MKTMRVVLLLVLAVVMARSAAAEEPDAELIAKITGLKPDVKNGIAKISVPRVPPTCSTRNWRLYGPVVIGASSVTGCTPPGRGDAGAGGPAWLPWRGRARPPRGAHRRATRPTRSPGEGPG